MIKYPIIHIQFNGWLKGALRIQNYSELSISWLVEFSLFTKNSFIQKHFGDAKMINWWPVEDDVVTDIS